MDASGASASSASGGGGAALWDDLLELLLSDAGLIPLGAGCAAAGGLGQAPAGSAGCGGGQPQPQAAQAPRPPSGICGVAADLAALGRSLEAPAMPAIATTSAIAAATAAVAVERTTDCEPATMAVACLAAPQPPPPQQQQPQPQQQRQMRKQQQSAAGLRAPSPRGTLGLLVHSTAAGAQATSDLFSALESGSLQGSSAANSISGGRSTSSAGTPPPQRCRSSSREAAARHCSARPSSGSPLLAGAAFRVPQGLDAGKLPAGVGPPVPPQLLAAAREDILASGAGLSQRPSKRRAQVLQRLRHRSAAVARAATLVASHSRELSQKGAAGPSGLCEGLQPKQDERRQPDQQRQYLAEQAIAAMKRAAPAADGAGPAHKRISLCLV